MYDMKALYEAQSVEHAVALRLEHPEAQIIAGGSDVLVQMREGRRAGKELISIYMIDELRGVTIDEDENIRIGSLTSFSHITRDPIIQKYINVLGEAVPDQKYRHHRRQHLQRRHLCRLRLDPPRVGGDRRADGQERRQAYPDQGFLHQCGYRGYSR